MNSTAALRLLAPLISCVPALAVQSATRAPNVGQPGSGGPVRTAPGTHDWERTNPGGGGAIAMVGATASGTILSASDLSGVFRSVDGGASWDVLGSVQGLTQTHTSCLGFHATDGLTFFVGSGWGIYKTTDGGEHFDFVHRDGYIESIAMGTSDDLVGYAAYHYDWDTPGEVFRTTDGGDTWHHVPGEDLPNSVRITKVLVHPLDAGIVYALGGKTRWGCSAASLYRSSDGGVHWQEISQGFPGVLDVDINPLDPSHVFASTFVPNACAPDQSLEEYLGGDEYSGEFYGSVDGGLSWSQLSQKTGIISVGHDPQDIRLVDIMFPYDWNPDAGTWATTNGGTSWNHVGDPANWNRGWSGNQYFAFALSFNGLNKTLTKDRFHPERMYGSFGQWAWASFDGGVTVNNISTRSVSPGRWRSTGMENINGHALAISESNPDVIYMGGYDIGLWTSQDRGGSWKRSIPDYHQYPDYVWDVGEGANVTALVADPSLDGVVWAVFHKEGLGNGSGVGSPGTNSALFKSPSFGDTWSLSNAGLPDTTLFYGLSLDPSSAPGSRRMFITVAGDVYRSTDDGDHWSLVLANGGLKFTSVDSASPSLVYAGGENGLWRSTDGGGLWTEVGLAEMRGPLVGNFLPTENGWEGVFQVVADPAIGGRVYVVVHGAGKGLYRSDNGGSTWSKLYTNSYMRGVAVTSQDGGLIYATSSASYFSGGYNPESKGVVFSRDGGGHWTSASNRMAWLHGGRIAISPGPSPYVVAWSSGPGLQFAPVPFQVGP